MPRLPTSAPDPVSGALPDDRGFRRLLVLAAVKLVVALAVPLLVLLGLVLYLDNSAGWVDHSDLVISQGRRVETQLITIQTELRGYLRAYDERFLAPYAAARAQVGPELAALAKLVADNPVQAAAADKIRANTQEWFAFVDRQLAVTRSGHALVRDPAYSPRGSPVFEHAEDAVTALIGAEEQVRILREARLHRVVAALMSLFAAAALVGLPGLAFWLQRQLRHVGRSYRESLVEAERRANELREMQRQLESASRAKDDFLAALSHELRTPLTPVLLAAASLREQAGLPAEVREQLAMIDRNISLEARLIDDLLDLTAVAHGKIRLSVEACDAHALIALAIGIVEGEAAAKGVALAREFGARRSGVQADPARFQQIIWNILRNAVKFTPRGGRIAVTTRDETDDAGRAWLRIEISDSGAGIESGALEEIFLPFRQGPGVNSRHVGGMGLGLAIARAIVDLHEGRIRAESTGPSRGATFIVELPGAVEPPRGAGPEPLAAAPAAAAPRPAASWRLLVVDDHPETLRALRHLLVREGHQVVTAGTLGEALSAAAAAPFDFVISDVGLPDGTGNELMVRLRERYGLRGIALSGYGMQEDIARSRAAGFVAHLVKPINFPALRRALAQYGPGAG